MKIRHLRFRMVLPIAVVLIAGAVAPLASDATRPMMVQGARTLPSPEQFFGFQMGADRKLAGWDRLYEYYQLLAKQSDRVTIADLGTSSEGRPFIALFISSPANLARLDEYRQVNARLGDPRGLSETEGRQLAARGKAVIIQSFALHSSEVAASQTAAEFVYESLSRNDEEARRVLDNVISIVLPSINPDGTQMIADWYMKYVGTEYEAAGLPWLYQTYAGHDNNRDGFALNLPESQHIAKLMYRDWLPQAYMDHHQMGNGGARLFIPPYAEPIRPGGDPLVWREITEFGGHMGTRLEAAGRTGVIGAAIYSGWGHMGFHWITPFHNIAGMLNESASARLATPVYQHFDQLRGGTRGLPEYEEQTTMPSLWPGGWWRVRDIVENQKIVAWSMVDFAARNREDLLWNMYLKGIRQTERGARADVKAYAIADDQHDPLTVRKLVNMLLDSNVDVQRATTPFVADGRAYGAGSFVVTMAQPKQGLVRWMLGETHYPDNTYTRDRDGDPIRPYDMSTDTFAEFMGVRADPIGGPIEADLVKLTAHVPLAGTLAPRGAHGYVLDGQLNDSFRAAFLLMADGIDVRRASAASPDGQVKPGDFLVAQGAVAGVAARSGVDFAALRSALSTGTYALRRPRVGLLKQFGGGNSDEGWTRLMFEQFDVPFSSLTDAQVRAGQLAASYDTIILPAASAGGMIGSAGGGRGGPTPPEYRSGFGAEGVRALQAFVEAGGTLLTFGEAGDLPIEQFRLPVRNAVADLPSRDFWCPGSTLKVTFDNAHPLVYGMPPRGLALFLDGSQVYEVTSTTSSQDVTILSKYIDRDILQSGWLLGEAVIARKAAAVSVRLGRGRVVLIGFRPQHRDQTHGTFKMVFNALLNGPPDEASR